MEEKTSKLGKSISLPGQQGRTRKHRLFAISKLSTSRALRYSPSSNSLSLSLWSPLVSPPFRLSTCLYCLVSAAAAAAAAAAPCRNWFLLELTVSAARPKAVIRPEASPFHYALFIASSPHLLLLLLRHPPALINHPFCDVPSPILAPDPLSTHVSPAVELQHQSPRRRYHLRITQSRRFRIPGHHTINPSPSR